jgi:hypothetical protein
MRTRTFLGVVAVSCLALLTVGAPAGRPQPVPTPVDAKRDTGAPAAPVAPTPAIPSIDLPASPPLDGFKKPTIDIPDIKVAPPAPANLSVEQMLTELEQLQKHMAEMKKKEELLKSKLREMLKDQEDRLRKVGVVQGPDFLMAPLK